MIVKINEKNAHLYNALFAKAYDALKAKNQIKDEAKNDDEGRFKNLNHYLAHAEELLAIDPAYLLLPLDEPTFDINADTRNIKASKIVILQNDHNAETIQFTIDRYFDYMDLKEARIYAQWTLPSGKEGATWVDEAKDLSIPGKIRFGWPLTEEVTSEPGIVKYSIRFWNKSLNPKAGKDEVEYSFNTLTSTLTVSPSLQPEVNTDANNIVAPVAKGFARAVRNSQITLEGRDLPLAPYFFEPGIDLPAYASLDPQEDTLTLTAQAGVGDTGALAYQWYFKPAVSVEVEVGGKKVVFNNETFYAYDDKTVKVDGKNVTIYGFKHFNGTIYDGNGAGRELQVKEFNWQAAGKLNIGDRYYVKNGESYVAYDNVNVPNDLSVKLYEKVTQYVIPKGDEKVTGQYKVCATNTIEPNTTAEMPSTICQLISPDNVVITADLPDKLFISTDEKNPTKALEVKIKPQASKDVNVVYDWRVGTDSSTVDEDVAAAGNENTFTPTTPGWYQLHIDATLNRETKSGDSKVCKVTYMPVVPAMNYTADTLANKMQQYGDQSIPLFTQSGNIDLEIVVTDPNPSGVDKALYTEGYEYVWYVTTPSATTRKVVSTDEFYRSGLNTKKLTVDNLSGHDRYVFKCIVTNTLNGKTASNDLSTALPFYVE